MTYGGLNKQWYASAQSTAAGIIVEYTGRSSPTNAGGTGQTERYRLRGVAISGTSAVALSTVPLMVHTGDSSAGVLTSQAIMSQRGVNGLMLTGLMGIEGGYIAISSTIAHADGGLTVSIWGD